MTTFEPPPTTTIRPIPNVEDPDMANDVAKFERMLDGFLDGSIEEDVFRVFRLNNGIYGQRQGGTNQMVRVRIPYGQVTPDQLDMFGYIVDTYSRGWGHITTRQNIQMHFVELRQIPDVLRLFASVGLSSREACGDTVRNVQGCHLAGACPFEVLDITAWAAAADRHLLRNPIAQRLPRKFKVNFSGCETDCGQAMFNDAGVVAAKRTLPDGTVEHGFRVFVAGGLGANPHPALVLEDFTTKEDLLPTIESILRVFDQTGNRDNKIRARMKWVVDELGIEEVRRRVIKTRHLLPASTTWPGGVPPEVLEHGDSPAGLSDTVEPTPIGQGVSVRLGSPNPIDRWQDANVVRGVANGSVSAYAWCELGDITGDQFRALATIQRDLGSDVRVTNRQNLVFRGLVEEQLPELYQRLDDIGMAQPGAELSRDVVACPGTDTCNLAVTQSRGLAKAIADELEEEGLDDVGGIRINISGCTNSCGQHHVADIGFYGTERRTDGRSAPGYQMLLGGYLGEEQVYFGERALRLPAKNVPSATAFVLRNFTEERTAGESFRSWIERRGGSRSLGKDLKHFDKFPKFDEDPSFYVDYDEAAPFEVAVGDSECAT